MQLTPDSPGRLVFAIRNAWAYVPYPLPPRIEPSWELLNHCAEAERELATLSTLFHEETDGTRIGDLLKPALLESDAASNCRIEGAEASYHDLMMLRAAESDSPGISSVPAPLHNAREALAHGGSVLKKDGPTIDLFRQLRAKLYSGAEDAEELKQLRSSQTWEGDTDDIREATFVPPPPPEMHGALAELERFTREPSEFPPLIQIALIHYQVAIISPFERGTGIINRHITQLLLQHHTRLPGPILLFCRWLESRAGEYRSKLQAVAFDGEWEAWLLFFLRGLAESAADTTRRATALFKLRGDMRATFPNPRSSAGPLQLLDHFFAQPLLSLKQAAELMDASFQTTSNNMNKLLEKGFVDEITGARRGQRFLAREVFSLLEDNDHAARHKNGR